MTTRTYPIEIIIAVAKSLLKPGEKWEYLTYKQVKNRMDKAIAILDEENKDDNQKEK